MTTLQYEQASASDSFEACASRSMAAIAADLNRRYEGLDGEDLVRVIFNDGVFGDRIALQSSFGAEAALLLDIVAKIDPAFPVLFNDTLMHFPETLQYKTTLVKQLGLTNVWNIYPDGPMQTLDPQGDLHQGSTQSRDLCCQFRKVAPMASATQRFVALLNGRKKYHGGERTDLQIFTAENDYIKVNPLLNWDAERIDREFEERGLPRHPLWAQGFRSIGCSPEQCTRKPVNANDPRSGRWASDDGKTECKLHAVPHSL